MLNIFSILIKTYGVFKKLKKKFPLRLMIVEIEKNKKVSKRTPSVTVIKFEVKSFRSSRVVR